ncbi:SDH family Clp fold serine proteinase [Bordetella genomosp. 13]|uniref:SDH family Clp fold serine proteinase n=1 Tax=Bordetella genomosp. 13 TaxID=463040 RepID=UPI000A3214DA|nr:ATP-dependent Clp protease proteolytic subunit [Bordetella genomosp. 13]
MANLDTHIGLGLDYYCSSLESYFECPLLAYLGPIHPAILGSFIQAIEELVRLRDTGKFEKTRRIVIVLDTPGGIVEAVEKMVDVVRHHFDEVFFIVPRSAMSAGTIFCMSGDKIFMDYTSSLGPIDPQVSLQNGEFVPALGYIDKVQEFIEKSRGNTLTDAELIMLQRLDLATLRRYEQARDLSVSLLKEWLVKYKFKGWDHHATTNPGTPVTNAEKQDRAEQIAKDLSDNRMWHSHGRMIGINRLQNSLRLKIENYSQDDN